MTILLLGTPANRLLWQLNLYGEIVNQPTISLEDARWLVIGKQLLLPSSKGRTIEDVVRVVSKVPDLPIGLSALPKCILNSLPSITLEAISSMVDDWDYGEVGEES